MSAQASRQHSCMMPLWLLWYHCFYACPNPTFLCRPCWWATPTGDPNAGKSPLFGFIKSKFEKACSAAAASLLPNHTCGAGNLGKSSGHPCRRTASGPESTPVLDPIFLPKEPRIPKFIDSSRFVECATPFGTAGRRQPDKKRKFLTRRMQ